MLFILSILLLSATAEGFTLAQLISGFISAMLPYASFLFAAWVYYKNNNKDEKKQLDEKIKKMQEQIAEQGLQIQGHQQERERLVDMNNLRLENFEKRVSMVDSVVSDVQLIKARMDTQAEQIKEMRVEMKEYNKQMMDLIKSMNK